MRGYGQSDKPTAIEAYTDTALMADLDGLLDALGLEDAWFIGHDWGAMLLWQYALCKPERLRGLATLNIPFYPRPSSDPVEFMRNALGPEHYIVDFADSDAADKAFDADPEKFLRSVMRRLPVRRASLGDKARKPRPYSMLAGLTARNLPGEDLLTESDLAVFVDAFRAGGFTAPINWYRNWSRNWRNAEERSQTVNVPTMFIAANDDMLVQPRNVEAMRAHVPDIEIHTIYECGHWTQQEHPQAVNALLLDWLARRSNS